MTRLLLTTLVTFMLTQTAFPARAADEPINDSAVLRHLVLFKWKEGTPEDTVRTIEKAFAALPKKIDVIKDFEWGTNNSPEGLDQDFTHCFPVTFADEAGRAVYLPHPEHKAFVDVMRPHLDKVLVLDYWAGK